MKCFLTRDRLVSISAPSCTPRGFSLSLSSLHPGSVYSQVPSPHGPRWLIQSLANPIIIILLLVLPHCLCQVTVQHSHVQTIRNDIGQLEEIRPNEGLKLPEVNFCSPVEQLSLVTFFTVLYLSLSPLTKCSLEPRWQLWYSLSCFTPVVWVRLCQRWWTHSVKMRSAFAWPDVDCLRVMKKDLLMMGFKALDNARYTSSSFSNGPYLLCFWPVPSFEIRGVIWTEFRMVLSLLFVLNLASNVALGRAMSVSWLVLQLWLRLK